MIDAEVRRLAQAQIGPRMEERRRVLSREIERINAQMAVRGLGSSSVRTQAIQDVCEQEAVLRVQAAWTELKVVLAALGVTFTDQLAADLKAEMTQHAHIGDLLHIVNRVAGDDQRLRAAAQRAVEMAGSDIDLYTVNLKRVAEQQGKIGQPILNFHGPVGAVQTGPYASATIVQNIGAEERQALVRALDELRGRVDALEADAMPAKIELVELIDDARAEVTKERPNSLRLRSVLSGIATTVQTVAAAEAAYLALKTAAAAVGIQLP